MEAPSQGLPHSSVHASSEEYITSLLDFIASSSLHEALCGGVHISDFLNREPDLYSSLLPSSWRTWFTDVSIYDIIDLLIHEDLDLARSPHETWRGCTIPPPSLLEFITQIRDHTLERRYINGDPDRPVSRLDRRNSVGMSAKKEHEVANFAYFVSDLIGRINANSHNTTPSITHLIDFGSGQNYLGRILAGPMYTRNVVALESQPSNIDGARKIDVHLKLAKKTVIWRNKKMFKAEGKDTAESERHIVLKDTNEPLNNHVMQSSCSNTHPPDDKVTNEFQHRMTYIEHIIQDGNLDTVTRKVQGHMRGDNSNNNHKQTPGFMVMSLHSCGNLVHHGLRSLILNPSVKAVAMIGCCYNLCTERLGPITFKLPTLRYRSPNQRLVNTSLTRDPNGFPMSDRFLKYNHAKGPGIRFNITARMMAVQAPANWTQQECGSFFTKHFYRALLQRVFLDIGFVLPPALTAEATDGEVKGWVGGTEPIMIGRLSKACYKTFVAYVRGAVQKVISLHSEQGAVLTECMKKVSDNDLEEYERRYIHRKHELCVVWSLMAFAAQLVECCFVADRWQWLMEQDDIDMAWVQSVFDYQQSPRNLAIIGIKK